MLLSTSYAKWRPFCRGLIVLSFFNRVSTKAFTLNIFYIAHPSLQIVDYKRKYFLTRAVTAVYSVAQAMHNAVARKCEDAFGDM